MLRICCLLIVSCTLLLPAVATFADEGAGVEAGLQIEAVEAQAPVRAATLQEEQCPEPAEASNAAGFAEKPIFAAPPDFILCSCRYCYVHPQDVCRISPSGFSIVCEDYFHLNC